MDSGPFDWTPCYLQTTNPIPNEPTVLVPDEDENGGGDDDVGEDGYGGTFKGMWARQGGAEPNSIIPLIEEVQGN